jgi:hypothetical protein
MGGGLFAFFLPLWLDANLYPSVPRSGVGRVFCAVGYRGAYQESVRRVAGVVCTCSGMAVPAVKEAVIKGKMCRMGRFLVLHLPLL